MRLYIRTPELTYGTKKSGKVDQSTVVCNKKNIFKIFSFFTTPRKGAGYYWWMVETLCPPPTSGSATATTNS